MADWMMEMVRGPAGGVSGSRAMLVLAMVCAGAVFLAWAAATAGVFLGVWTWERFEGPIVSGGLGLLGVLLGSGGVYAANRFSFKPEALEDDGGWSDG